MALAEQKTRDRVVWLGQLPADVSKEALDVWMEQLFGDDAPETRVHAQSGKACAFLTFDNADAAERAREFGHTKHFNGKPVWFDRTTSTPKNTTRRPQGPAKPRPNGATGSQTHAPADASVTGAKRMGLTPAALATPALATPSIHPPKSVASPHAAAAAAVVAAAAKDQENREPNIPLSPAAAQPGDALTGSLAVTKPSRRRGTAAGSGVHLYRSDPQHRVRLPQPQGREARAQGGSISGTVTELSHATGWPVPNADGAAAMTPPGAPPSADSPRTAPRHHTRSPHDPAGSSAQMQLQALANRVQPAARLVFAPNDVRYRGPGAAMSEQLPTPSTSSILGGAAAVPRKPPPGFPEVPKSASSAAPGSGAPIPSAIQPPPPPVQFTLLHQSFAHATRGPDAAVATSQTALQPPALVIAPPLPVPQPPAPVRVQQIMAAQPQPQPPAHTAPQPISVSLAGTSAGAGSRAELQVPTSAAAGPSKSPPAAGQTNIPYAVNRNTRNVPSSYALPLVAAHSQPQLPPAAAAQATASPPDSALSSATDTSHAATAEAGEYYDENGYWVDSTGRCWDSDGNAYAYDEANRVYVPLSGSGGGGGLYTDQVPISLPQFPAAPPGEGPIQAIALLALPPDAPTGADATPRAVALHTSQVQLFEQQYHTLLARNAALFAMYAPAAAAASYAVSPMGNVMSLPLTAGPNTASGLGPSHPHAPSLNPRFYGQPQTAHSYMQTQHQMLMQLQSHSTSAQFASQTQPMYTPWHQAQQQQQQQQQQRQVQVQLLGAPLPPPGGGPGGHRRRDFRRGGGQYGPSTGGANAMGPGVGQPATAAAGPTILYPRGYQPHGPVSHVFGMAPPPTPHRPGAPAVGPVSGAVGAGGGDGQMRNSTNRVRLRRHAPNFEVHSAPTAAPNTALAAVAAIGEPQPPGGPAAFTSPPRHVTSTSTPNSWAGRVSAAERRQSPQPQPNANAQHNKPTERVAHLTTASDASGPKASAEAAGPPATPPTATAPPGGSATGAGAGRDRVQMIPLSALLAADTSAAALGLNAQPQPPAGGAGGSGSGKQSPPRPAPGSAEGNTTGSVPGSASAAGSASGSAAGSTTSSLAGSAVPSAVNTPNVSCAAPNALPPHAPQHHQHHQQQQGMGAALGADALSHLFAQSHVFSPDL